MAKYISNRQQNLKIGIVSYTQDKTVLEVIGNVGIGTTNATSKLTVVGDARITGILTIGTSSIVLDGANNKIYVGSGVTISATEISIGSNIIGSGGFSGNASSATFATSAGIATNLKGGVIGNIPYQSAADTTAFLTNGGSGTILQSNGVGNLPTWVTPAAAGAITGLTIRDEGTIVGGASSVSALNFVGSIVSVASTAGIATITFLDYVSNAGIATFATNAGIATYATNAGIATFATNAGIATFATSAGIATYATNAGIATYATNAGVSTYATNAGVSTYATNAGIATALQYPRTFEITGDIVASPISFDGTGNVSLAATIQPNSVGLGTDTTGDYVRDITGTANQITVTGGTGESSTPTLTIPSQFTAPQDVTVTRDLSVSRNLNVNGNITIGGTSATLFTTELKIADPDIVLGFRTDGSGNDVSNDNTANHGGVALASTEGTPLVQLFIAGIETAPATYKKIMWFKSGTFSGLGTDAWLFNYAVGIGSTQFPTGTRLAAGNVQFTQNDLAVVRNVNASGIVTATSGFDGNASSATYATNAGIATYATNAGIATYATNAGVSTYATNAGIATFATNAGISTNLKGGVIGNIPYQSAADTTAFLTNGDPGTILKSNGVGSAPTWVTPAPAGAITGLTIRDEGTIVGGANSISALNFFGSIVSVASTAGIATITFLDYVSNAGIATYATNAGIATFATNAGVSTYATNAGIATFATNAGISTNLKGGVIGNIPYQSAADTTAFLTNGDPGTILKSNGVGSAPTWVTPAPAGAITGLTIRDENNIVSGLNSVSALNFVGSIVSVASTAGIATITFLDYVGNAGVATYATNAGIATYATNAGIATFATNAGIATFATNAGIATFATSAGIATYATSSGIATYATSSGVSTSVIGGIGSITQLQVTGVSTFTNGPVFIGAETSTGTALQRLQVTGGAYVSDSVGIGTTNPAYTLHVQGNARITGAFRDSTDSTGTSGQVLQSTQTGTQWATAAAGGGKFDTSIDNVLYVQPTGTLDIVGVGTTTTQITTLPSGTTKYLVHSIHVTNISNGDAEITAGFVLNARKVPATISVSVGSSGGPGIHTFTVGSASSITVGMAVTGTGNIGETTGIGSTAGFQFNTYATSVDGNNITLSKPMSGRATGVLYFSPVSNVVSRLPVPVGSAVELLKQPMILNALDSIVLQSTGAGTGIGSASTATISQTANSNFLTVTVGAAITNFLSSGMLIQGTGTNTGIQTNTFVGVGYTSGSLSIPMTRPTTSTLASQSLSFTEVVVPQDGALQVTVVYQSSTDTSYQNGTGTVVAISSNTTSVTAGLSTIPVAYYGTGNVYPSIIQSIRVSNISDRMIYPGGDYPVWVGIGNSDTIFSWLSYNMVIPKNSSIELCESPKRLGIGQSIFAYSDTPNAIEIQIAGKQKTS